METTETVVLETPRSLRVRLGLRQADVAERAQVSERTLCEIDAGHDVATRSIRAVAKVLDVSPGFLLDAMTRERILRKSRNLFSRHASLRKGKR